MLLLEKTLRHGRRNLPNARSEIRRWPMAKKIDHYGITNAALEIRKQ
jgi:hypothetical protein